MVSSGWSLSVSLSLSNSFRSQRSMTWRVRWGWSGSGGSWETRAWEGRAEASLKEVSLYSHSMCITAHVMIFLECQIVTGIWLSCQLTILGQKVIIIIQTVILMNTKLFIFTSSVWQQHLSYLFTGRRNPRPHLHRYYWKLSSINDQNVIPGINHFVHMTSLISYKRRWKVIYAAH